MAAAEDFKTALDHFKSEELFKDTAAFKCLKVPMCTYKALVSRVATQTLDNALCNDACEFTALIPVLKMTRTRDDAWERSKIGIMAVEDAFGDHAVALETQSFCVGALLDKQAIHNVAKTDEEALL